MQTAQVVVAPKPPLKVRVIVGLCLSGVSLLLLVVPGEMLLPMVDLSPLMPHAGGCFNFLAIFIVLAVFGLGILLSVVLLIVGIVGITLAAKQVRGGLVTSVLVDVMIATLFLVSPLTYSRGQFSNAGELLQNGVFYSAFAVLPLASAVLLLAPSLYRSSRSYAATLIVASLLLLPGAAGLAVLALDASGIGVSHTPATTTTARSAHC